MAYDNHISKKLIVPIGIFIIFAVASLVLYKQNEKELETKERVVASFFAKFRKYDETVYIPNAEIIGPGGRTYKLKDDFEGEYLILNIWATWCGPCVKELPELQKIQRLLGDGQYRVLAVSVNAQSEIDSIVKFIKKYNVESVAGFHDYKGEIQKNLPLKNLPTTYILNPKGRILYEITGDGRWTNPQIISFLKFLKTVH